MAIGKLLEKTNEITRTTAMDCHPVRGRDVRGRDRRGRDVRGREVRGRDVRESLCTKSLNVTGNGKSSNDKMRLPPRKLHVRFLYHYSFANCQKKVLQNSPCVRRGLFLVSSKAGL